HERGRDGRANFRERCACSLSRCQWRGAHKNTGRTGSVLPEFPVAGEKFCGVRRFSRRACTARRNCSQTGSVAGKTAHVTTGSEKRGLHFQKSGRMSCGKTGGRVGIEKLVRRTLWCLT